MGNSHSGFTEEELTEYEELTFLTRKEILHAWVKWKELVEDSLNEDKSRQYPAKKVFMLPELQHNPFSDRIALHFGERTTAGADSDHPLADITMNFDNFLDLLNVMSPKAPPQLKAHYAFKIFDFNGDTVLDRTDLEEILMRLTGEQLDKEATEQLIDKLLEETDMEGDQQISEEEFKHLLTKCPDFTLSFRFTL